MNDLTSSAHPDTGQVNTNISPDAVRTGSLECGSAGLGVGELKAAQLPALGTKISNEATASSSQPLVAGSAPSTLGGLLRASRVARTLSLDEVFAQTNIAVPHLAALENDEAIALPQTFVKGYAKSYAKFLGIEPEFLNKFFEATPANANTIINNNTASAISTSPLATSAGQQPEVKRGTVAESKVQMPAALESTARKVTDSIRKSVGFRTGSSWSNGLLGSPMGLLRVATTTTLPLLGLCVLAFAYHAIDSQFSDASRISASSHSLGQAPDQLGVLAHEALTAQHAQSNGHRLPAGRIGQVGLVDVALVDVALVDVALLDNAAQPPQAKLEVAALAQNNAAGSNRTNAAGSFQIQGTGASPRQDVTLAALVNVEPTPGLAASTSPPGSSEPTLAAGFASQAGRSVVPNTNMHDMHEPVGPGAVGMIAQLNMQDRLVIQVYEDSWVDVSDGSGNKLYRDLARAGRRIDVSGQLPFALHLGNAPGLELELNGESIAITRYRSDNSARLTLASN